VELRRDLAMAYIQERKSKHGTSWRVQVLKPEEEA
jgi:hypothetical protein